MRIAAVADVHSPRYLTEFKDSLGTCTSPDVFLLAGDMIEAGRFYEYQRIVEVITDRLGDELPIVACIGNDEQDANLSEAREIVQERITFLNGQNEIVRTGSMTVGIHGVPLLNVMNTSDIQNLETLVETRIEEISESLESLNKRCDRTVLLMHYSPLTTDTYPVDFHWWMTRVFRKTKPDLIIHGHIHYATNPDTRIGTTRVVNVAFPATRKVTEISLS